MSAPTQNPTLLPKAAVLACFEAVYLELHERFGVADPEAAMEFAAKVLDAIDAGMRADDPEDAGD